MSRDVNQRTELGELAKMGGWPLDENAFVERAQLESARDVRHRILWCQESAEKRRHRLRSKLVNPRVEISGDIPSVTTRKLPDTVFPLVIRHPRDGPR